MREALGPTEAWIRASPQEPEPEQAKASASFRAGAALRPVCVRGDRVVGEAGGEAAEADAGPQRCHFSQRPKTKTPRLQGDKEAQGQLFRAGGGGGFGKVTGG